MEPSVRHIRLLKILTCGSRCRDAHGVGAIFWIALKITTYNFPICTFGRSKYQTDMSENDGVIGATVWSKFARLKLLWLPTSLGGHLDVASQVGSADGKGRKGQAAGNSREYIRHQKQQWPRLCISYWWSQNKYEQLGGCSSIYGHRNGRGEGVGVEPTDGSVNGAPIGRSPLTIRCSQDQHRLIG